MVNLGLLLNSGKLGAPDPSEAFRWIRRAAEADDPLAQQHLALFYARGEGTEYDPAQAYKWMQLARLQIETTTSPLAS